ncbi:MAG: EamA family transporter [Candidatus Aenigmarchaeota archaeon]|nr:EamA family transporter [Candidatus Aenigmarchaeota archaeon]
MSVLLLVLTCVLIGVIGQLAMKKGMNVVGVISLKDIFSWRIFQIVFQRYVFIGIVLYVLASLIWLVVLSKEELSFVYPLISIGYLITAILSKIFFNEILTVFRFFGIILICSGVYLIVMKI